MVHSTEHHIKKGTSTTDSEINEDIQGKGQVYCKLIVLQK